MTPPKPPPQTGPATEEVTRTHAFVREHFAFVWRVLRRLGLEPSDADDATQRVMLVASRRIDAIKPGYERSFLYQTAVFMASRERRSLQRRREEPAEFDEWSSPGLDPERLLAERRARERLDAILLRMPDDLRVAFVLFEIEGMSKQEVANALGIPEGTAASRLRRAREEFLRRARHVEHGARPKGATA
jgi:RNA polymerase sigma-70 factor (ECF subfamily)